MPEKYYRDRAKLLEQDRISRRPAQLLDEERVHYAPGMATPDKALFTIVRAMKARHVARSYREFKVGAAGFINRDSNSAIVMKHGGNYKNRSGDSEIDDHAEQVVLRNMQSGDELSILAVIGLPQPDHASGEDPCTLHPCGKCRKRLGESEHVSEKTLIITATPDGKNVEWGGLDDYLTLHEGGNNTLQRAQFDLTPVVFEPVLASDLPEVDTTEWDQQFTYPVLEWIIDRQ